MKNYIYILIFVIEMLPVVSYSQVTSSMPQNSNLDFIVEKKGVLNSKIYLLYHDYIDVYDRILGYYQGRYLYDQSDIGNVYFRIPIIESSRDTFFLPTTKGVSIYEKGNNKGRYFSKKIDDIPLNNVGKILKLNDSLFLLSTLYENDSLASIIRLNNLQKSTIIEDTLFSLSSFSGLYPINQLSLVNDMLIYRHLSSQETGVLDLTKRDLLFSQNEEKAQLFITSDLDLILASPLYEESYLHTITLKRVDLHTKEELTETSFKTNNGNVVLFGNVMIDGVPCLLAYRQPREFRISPSTGESRIKEENEFLLIDGNSLEIVDRISFNSLVYTDSPIKKCQFNESEKSIYVLTENYLYEIKNIFQGDQSYDKLLKITNCR